MLELEVEPVVVGGEAHAEVKQRAYARLQLPLRRMLEVARDDCRERLAIHDPDAVKRKQALQRQARFWGVRDINQCGEGGPSPSAAC